jgi:hypothetical protein
VKFAVARFDTVVTAVHSPAGIELRTWHIDPSGQPTPKALVTKVAGSYVALAGLYDMPGSLEPGLFGSVIVQDADHKLRVALWKVAPDGTGTLGGQWLPSYDVDGSQLALAGDAGAVMNAGKSPRFVRPRWSPTRATSTSASGTRARRG